MATVQIAYVALGSNLGDRDALLRRAVELLQASAGVDVVAGSRVFETAPVGPAPQGPYLNAVLRLATQLTPRALLARMLEIETECGRRREREARWGPRTLDLDLLLFGDCCVAEPGLELPHPRLHERSFVLEPLCDLAADELHPRLGTALGDLAKRARRPGDLAEWPCAPLVSEPRREQEE